MLERIFRSNAEVKILGIVLFEQGLHLREIARRARISPYEAKRELDIFLEIGVLTVKKRGNQSIFYLNDKCTFTNELKNLYQKTEGVFAELNTLFDSLVEVKFAFIFGSATTSKEKENSDVDLMIIGDVDEHMIATQIFKIQQKTKKEINFILWNRKDMVEKSKRNSQFLKNVIAGKKIWMKGTEDEFVRFVEKGPREAG